MTSEPVYLIGSLAASELPAALSIELGTPFSLAAQSLPCAVSIHVLGGMGSARRLAKTLNLNIDRTEYADIAEQYTTGARQADTVLVSLAQAPDGSLHLGGSHGPVLEAARRARQVIAEINTSAPIVNGAAWPEDIPLAHKVHCQYKIASIECVTEASTEEKTIAAHLAELIANGACLQVGIGSLPGAVLSLLASHRNLGIHTGLISDSLYELMQQQAVNNSFKPARLQASITGCVYGTSALYQAVEQDDRIVLAAPNVTHSPSVLRGIRQFTAINSAVEIDLLGRVNAESALGPDGSRHHVGGVGGLPCYVRGALASPGGLSVIALPSRSSSGGSRIVKSLDAEVTLDAMLADIVVTEHGVARLRGASAESRRRQLIAIADPEDRDVLGRS